MNFESLYKFLKKQRWIQIFVIYTRYLIGGAFTFASIVKIKGERFLTDIRFIEDSPWHSVGHYFETMYQSGLYWQFLGWGQLIAAFLLMTQRYAKLGAVVFFPIILNIFVITISYDFHNTHVITFFMLLATIMLLVWDWDDLKVLLNLSSSSIKTNSSFEKLRIWEWVGLLIFSLTILFKVFYPVGFGLIIWLLSCFLIGIVALIIGLRQTRSLKIDV